MYKVVNGLCKYNMIAPLIKACTFKCPDWSKELQNISFSEFPAQPILIRASSRDLVP